MPSHKEQLESALASYDKDDNLGTFMDAVRGIAKSASIEELIALAAPYTEHHEVIIPIYEHITAQRPNDAKALVALANAYWLTGRGPDVVGELEAMMARQHTRSELFPIRALDQAK